MPSNSRKENIVNLKNYALIIGVLILVVLSAYTISAAWSRANVAYTQTEGFTPYQGDFGFPLFDRSMCGAGQDFILQVDPLGCEPSVVRSDLLEEQNVPVFCPIVATKLNTMIDIKAINDISFSFAGKKPEGVVGVRYVPARAALGKYGAQLNQPILNNIGYAVIILKRHVNESAMPEFILGNLTARISYDIQNSMGVGRSVYYLPTLTEDEWQENFRHYSFLDGRGYLRAEGVDNTGAVISVYSDRENFGSGISGEKRKLATFNLNVGETSGEMNLPGFDYCMGDMRVILNGLENPDTRVNLNVNGDVLELKEGEKFLDNRCTVRFIEDYGINENVIVSCQGDSERGSFQIGVNPKLKINIADSSNLGGEERELAVGQKLYKIDNEKSAYLAYIGTKTNAVSESDLFIVVMSTDDSGNSLTESQIRSIGRLMKNFRPSEETGVGLVDIFLRETKYGYGLIEEAGRRIVAGQLFESVSFGVTTPVFGKTLSIRGFGDASDSDLTLISKKVTDPKFQNYYSNSFEDYDFVEDVFSDEKSIDSSDTFGQKALSGKINLASSAGQKRTALELCNEFSGKYPNYEEPACNDVRKLSSSEKSSESVVINGRFYNIAFDSIREPSFNEFGAEVSIRNESGDLVSVELRKNTVYNLNETTGEYLQLLDLSKDELDRGATARIKVSLRKTTTFKEVTSFVIESSIKTLIQGTPESFGSNYRLTLDKVNLEKIAKVSVKPNIDYARTNSTLKFRIGIEKRAIQLSPEQTRSRIKSLNKTLEKFQDINGKLGDVVGGLKAACFITGKTLTVKNFFSNRDGKGIARQEVMRGKGGWFSICENEVSGGAYSGSIDSCLLNNSDKIDNEVNIVSDIIKNQETITDENAAQKLVGIRSSIGNFLVNPENANEVIDISTDSDVGSVFTSEGFIEGKITPTQTKDLGRLQTILETDGISDELRKRSEKERYLILSDIKENTKYFATNLNLATKHGVSPNQIPLYKTQKYSREEAYTGVTYGNIQNRPVFENIGDIGDNAPVQILPTDYEGGKTYYAFLDDSGAVDKFIIKINADKKKLVYDVGGNLVPEEELKKINLDKVIFKRTDQSSYQNPFSEEPMVRYYEFGTYAGTPAIVPFDLVNGWYAYVRPTVPIGGAIRAYDASGRVNSFYLCNVGGNGKAEFNSGYGDDDCGGFLWKGQPPVFTGLDTAETKRLKDFAEGAISDATRQYKPKISGVIIRSPSGSSNKIKVGPPETGNPEIQCQDFMSPRDCNLLFNVCDPVVCPSSRCDLGGAYPVKDVIQSGIAGSLLLCKENFPEVKIPVCLSGVHAGIDGLTTVIDSYQQCLQTSLETGQTTGVCDEIHSVYMCDFVWRQSIPLAKLAITKGLGTALGQNTNAGGGEYLGVANALETASQSEDFFSEFYASNSFNAFKTRSLEDVGTPVCKNFISISGFSGGNFFDALTTPDSPSQFYGRFDEIPFTTATNPPVSQYKVFYHVYSGKDFPAQYQVYLRGTGSSFYQDAGTRRIVAQGFIKAGDYFTETRDITAPSGYQEMCIVVNGNEECGFKQVTTSFGLNYVTEQYVASQASQTDITSEAACVSGTSSVYSLLSPNLQAGATEATNPAIYNRGITRVCSTGNPGLGTDSFAETNQSRWQLAGHCGDPKLKCWLDTNSVKDVIRNTNIEDKALAEVSNQYVQTLQESNGYLTDAGFNKVVEDVNAEENNFRKINLINNNIDKVLIPNQKGFLTLLRADAYKEIVSQLYGKYLKSIEKEITAPEDDKAPETSEEKQREIDEAVKAGLISGFAAYPIFLYEDGTTAGNLYYTYSGTGWFWSEDKNAIGVSLDGWRASDSRPPNNFLQKNKNFIASLRDKDYSEGLNLLMGRTVANNEGGLAKTVTFGFAGNAKLSTENVVFSPDEIFTLSGEEVVTISTSRFDLSTREELRRDTLGYLEFDLSRGGKWTWSLDKNDWVDVPDTLFVGSISRITEPGDDLLKLVDELEGKKYPDGAETIFYVDAALLGPKEFIKAEVNCDELVEGRDLSVKFSSCITAEKINQILEVTPAKNTGEFFVKYGEQYGVDPIIALAFFEHESNFGREGVAKNTNSVGNIRYSSSCPGTDFNGFCKYNSWEDGIEHWYKLINSGVYVGSGLDTVEEIIPKYCPVGDNCDVNGYIASVRDFVGTYA